MADPLRAGMTKFFFDGEELAMLEGAVSVPMTARVEIGDIDYIVDTVRVGIRPTNFDLYYECHPAEETGTRVDPRDQV